MLSLPEVAALLADAFRGRASRANFRTGTLTMCTMLPMRSVPHRVVCLLGVDDGVFPRPVRPDGDDIAERDPMGRRPGSAQRGPAAAAGRAAGRRGAAGGDLSPAPTRAPAADIPPAVPIGALLDALDTTARTPDGRRVREQRHRPPSAAAVRPRATSRRASWAPRAVQLRPGEPARRTRASGARPSGAAGRLSRRRPCRRRRRPRLLGLADLIRFFNHPAAGAAPGARPAVALGRRRRSRTSRSRPSWTGWSAGQVGERLLRLHLQGADLAVLAAAEWRRGTLPPRGFGARALDRSRRRGGRAWRRWPHRSGPAPVERREIVLDLPCPAEPSG